MNKFLCKATSLFLSAALTASLLAVPAAASQALGEDLSREAARQGSTFTIPFDRQQLADYLAVDRSAMSAELGKLRREGLLDFRKNRFTLLRRPEEHR